MDEKQSFFPKGIKQDDFNSTAVFVKSDFFLYHYNLILFTLVWLQTYVIVIEEEIVLTPDFLNFLSQCLPALAADDSLFGISAFNYNGKFYSFKCPPPPSPVFEKELQSSFFFKCTCN